jgi:hypothetical protein
MLTPARETLTMTHTEASPLPATGPAPTPNVTETPGGSRLCWSGYSLGELFAKIEHSIPKGRDRGMPAAPVHGDGTRFLYVSAPCEVPLYTYALPCRPLEHWINANMLNGMGDVFVKVTFRADDTALISLSYNSIIGSRWLCIVPAADAREFFAVPA